MRYMEYRTDFFFWMIISTLWTAFNFFFLEILISITGNIAGWTRMELYLIMGVFTIHDSFTWSFFYHNMQKYSQMIFDGGLNNVLMKPIDSQFMIMTSHNNYTNIPRFFIGLFIFFWAIFEMQLNPSFFEIIGFLFLFCVSLCLVYFIWFIIATLAFYFDKLENINEIIPSAREIYKFPRFAYQGIFSVIFKLILPLGLVSSIPSELILGKFSLNWTIYFVFITLLIAFISRKFFNFSIKNYSGVAN